MKRKRKPQGVSMVWVIVTITGLIAFLGFSIDVGNMVWAGYQLQVAADSAALAGARRVRTNDESLVRGLTAIFHSRIRYR